VYDSKSNKNASERRDMLKQKIGDKFAGYNLWMAVAEDFYPWSIRNAKAWCEFKKEEYGHDILVVLCWKHKYGKFSIRYLLQNI